jgi:hypothetical protein
MRLKPLVFKNAFDELKWRLLVVNLIIARDEAYKTV